MIEKFNEIKNITVEQINNYGDSEFVSSYYYVYETSMDAKDLEEELLQVKEDKKKIKKEKKSKSN